MHVCLQNIYAKLVGTNCCKDPIFDVSHMLTRKIVAAWFDPNSIVAGLLSIPRSWAWTYSQGIYGTSPSPQEKIRKFYVIYMHSSRPP